MQQMGARARCLPEDPRGAGLMTVQERPNVSVGDKIEATQNEILRVTVGSETHGMALEGSEDHDEMGVYVSSPVSLLGLADSKEHYISRTKPDGVRSEHGDTDLSMYSLRKYLRLACQGNPTVLLPVYSPPGDVLVTTPLGESLRRLGVNQFPTITAGYRFLGYLDSQYDRMRGIGARQNRVPSSPELIAAHGYDTKYASHALRLGLQGLQYMTEATLTLPMRQHDLDVVMPVKRGQVTQERAMALIEEVRAELADAIEQAEKHRTLPERPDMVLVNGWLVTAHYAHWRTTADGHYWSDAAGVLAHE